MKGKNILKEHVKKTTRKSAPREKAEEMIDKDYGVKYRVFHDNYEAEVRLKDTNEIVGVYRAAARDWRIIRLQNFLTHDIRVKVEALYT